MVKARPALTQRRTPRTRSKGRFHVIDDPIASDKALKTTLADLGLYAGHIIGDGNCLFSSLSDQLHGFPNRHHEIRKIICDYLASHKDQYAAFVDDPKLEPDAAFQRHVALMRQNATYGSHLEISVFARLSGRTIRVIQPGMIYVVNDKDESPAALAKAGQTELINMAVQPDAAAAGEEDLYIVYHSWEHYSSARNIAGPHTGLPKIKFKQPSSEPTSPSPAPREPVQPTPDEKLVLACLADPESHSLDEIRKLISSTGSWERAAEILIDKEQSAKASSDPEPSTSNLSSATKFELDSNLIAPERPSTPKRSLSESIYQISIESGPAAQRLRLSRASEGGSSLSSISDDESNETDLVSDFEELPSSPSPTEKAPYALRTRSKASSKTVSVGNRPRRITGREKKEAIRAKKREARQTRAKTGASDTNAQPVTTAIRELYI